VAIRVTDAIFALTVLLIGRLREDLRARRLRLGEMGVDIIHMDNQAAASSAEL